MKLSPGEEAFALHCRAEGLTPEREFKFHPIRKWRFDFAFNAANEKLAVEIEGGHFAGGRHGTGVGFEADCAKYNSAVLLGWRVMRFTTGMVYAGTAIDEVLQALGMKASSPPKRAVHKQR